MSTDGRTETDAALEAGQQLAVLAADPIFIGRETDDATLAVVVPDGHSLKTIDLTGLDNFRDRPRATARTVTVYSVEAFATYVARHNGDDGDTHLEVYADPKAQTVTGILDAPNHGSTAWGQHRVVLVTSPTAAWKRWNAGDGVSLGQSEFADLVETGIPDIAAPDGATLLEIVSTFVGQKSVEYESTIRRQTGETTLVYKEVISGSAGQGGRLEMPKELTLGLKPWTASPRLLPVTARLRYRIDRDKALRLTYHLDRLDELLEVAWDEIAASVETVVPAPVLIGTAPAR